MSNIKFTFISFLLVSSAQVCCDLIIFHDFRSGSFIFHMATMLFIIMGYYWTEIKWKLLSNPKATTTHILLSAFLAFLISFSISIGSYIHSIEPTRFYTFKNAPQFTPFPFAELMSILILLFLACQVGWIIWILATRIRASKNKSPRMEN